MVKRNHLLQFLVKASPVCAGSASECRLSLFWEKWLVQRMAKTYMSQYQGWKRQIQKTCGAAGHTPDDTESTNQLSILLSAHPSYD